MKMMKKPGVFLLMLFLILAANTTLVFAQEVEKLFSMDIEDLMDISDAGEVMPPKSTWFEPKLRSGLFIHRF